MADGPKISNYFVIFISDVIPVYSARPEKQSYPEYTVRLLRNKTPSVFGRSQRSSETTSTTLRSRATVDNHRSLTTPLWSRRSAAISASPHTKRCSTPPFFSDRTDTECGARGSKSAERYCITLVYRPKIRRAFFYQSDKIKIKFLIVIISKFNYKIQLQLQLHLHFLFLFVDVDDYILCVKRSILILIRAALEKL